MVTYNEVMLNRSNLRALHGARLSLSSWAQPSFLRLRGSHFLEPQLSRTAQTASPRIYSPWVPSVLPRKPLQTLQSLPRYRYPLNSRRAFSSGPQSSYQRNTYNRFGTAGRRQPLLFALVQYLKPHHYVMIGLGLSGVYLYNTDVVEVTGRRRFNIVSAKTELQMGRETYQQVLNEERGKILPDHHPLAQQVDRVLQRLIPLAPIEGADWKVHVIADPDMKNAFVLPGGKVFVATGILPICQDDDGLAAVLGHEIAHVVAHHPAERVSNSFMTMGVALLVALLLDFSGQTSSLVMEYMYSLPNSRTQEAEADHIGLLMMSKACFNPEAAVRLWQRMQKMEKGSPPQFLSTHPSSYNREEAIRGWLEKAEHIYAENGCSSLGSYMPQFQNALRSQGSSYGW
ncbi:hypothetical protein N7520_010412 [Penicillium odoratum]|uniref:uncharacterized protein n=1 Tax=Penicillium odoratum TaxID=1167516 RepID=UPI002547FC30|nr:uncharacterized protein N7520_010412 [Penicillium odoratum]KAJ5745230.1 hypothetical protein N7520_010412 [Penicillium odoratum]